MTWTYKVKSLFSVKVYKYQGRRDSVKLHRFIIFTLEIQAFSILHSPKRPAGGQPPLLPQFGATPPPPV